MDKRKLNRVFAEIKKRTGLDYDVSPRQYSPTEAFLIKEAD